jgi:hypothetical protein
MTVCSEQVGLNCLNYRRTWCREGESNPHAASAAPDFESGASPSSAIPARADQSRTGSEPGQGDARLARPEVRALTMRGPAR